jgi:hypothetical protein
MFFMDGQEYWAHSSIVFGHKQCLRNIRKN